MPRVHFVKSARKDYPNQGIKKGEPYYWFRFWKSGKIRRKTRPKRWELTRSSFFSQLWQLEDTWEWDVDNLESSIEEFKGNLELLKDECQYSLDNMPEQLQDSSDSGMLLQERIDLLEGWIGELDQVETEYNPEIHSDISFDDWKDQVLEELENCNPGIG